MGVYICILWIGWLELVYEFMLRSIWLLLFFLDFLFEIFCEGGFLVVGRGGVVKFNI